MKKLIIFIISFIISISSFIFPASAAFTSSFEVDADIAYVVSTDRDSSIIYDKRSTDRVNPASLVKVVTAILVIENCNDLNQTVTASETAIRRVEPFRVTTAGILIGENMTVEQLLYCLLVYNANDASTVLAEYIGGSEAEFVVMMNDFAKKLGLTDTLFGDPGGFSDAEQFSTARDIAEMFRYCMENSTFEKIISTFLYEMPETNAYHSKRYLKNTNYLINKGIPDYYFQYVKGGKSGYNENDNCNVVSMASKDGYNYICVVLDAGEKDYDGDDVTENMAFVASRQLYEWVFKNIKLRVVANTSTYVGEVKVRLSDVYDYVSLVPKEDVSALVPAGVKAESVLIEPVPDKTPDTVDAPVKKGEVLGRASIQYAGESVAEVDIVAAFDVEVSPMKYVGDKILKVLKSWIFRIIVLVLVVIAVPLGMTILRNRRPKKKMRVVKNTKNRK